MPPDLPASSRTWAFAAVQQPSRKLSFSPANISTGTFNLGDPAGHVLDERVGGIPGHHSGDLFRPLDSVVERHAAAEREADDGYFARQTVRRLHRLVDGSSDTFAVGVLHGVAVEQNDVVAERRDLLGDGFVVFGAGHAGGNYYDATFALRWRKFFLRGGGLGDEQSCEGGGAETGSGDPVEEIQGAPLKGVDRVSGPVEISG